MFVHDTFGPRLELDQGQGLCQPEHQLQYDQHDTDKQQPTSKREMGDPDGKGADWLDTGVLEQEDDSCPYPNREHDGKDHQNQLDNSPHYPFLEVLHRESVEQHGPRSPTRRRSLRWLRGDSSPA